MRGHRNSSGYTIVEVMIFLAVSGFMFVIAGGFISGRQVRSEFKQGMNEFNASVQQSINDVNNGFYPSIANFNCTPNPIGRPTISTLTANAQGTNQGCVFMGKILQFVPSGNNQAYDLITVAGRQYQGGPTTLPPQSFVQASPVAVTGAGYSLTENKILQWGLRITKVYAGSDNHDLGAVGIFQSFSGSSAGTLVSGGQNTILVEIPNSTLNQNVATLNGLIASPANLTLMDSASSLSPTITICLKGSGNQDGSLTIGGGNGQRLTTSIAISNAPTGSCP